MLLDTELQPLNKCNTTLICCSLVLYALKLHHTKMIRKYKQLRPLHRVTCFFIMMNVGIVVYFDSIPVWPEVEKTQQGTKCVLIRLWKQSHTKALLSPVLVVFDKNYTVHLFQKNAEECFSFSKEPLGNIFFILLLK